MEPETLLLQIRACSSGLYKYRLYKLLEIDYKDWL